MVTNTTEAQVAHQVISALRNGRLEGIRFAKAIVGGHSGGSTIAIQEAATFRDVDGVLLTGVAHHVNVANIAKVYSTMYPAPLDRRFTLEGVDPGYVTTRPGVRYQDFYAPMQVEDGVVETDERTKDVFSPGEAPDAFAFSVITRYSRAIDAPVLIAVGQQDGVVCGSVTGSGCSSASTLLATEAPYYSEKANLRTFVLPGSGHNINLAPNSAIYRDAVVQWANEFVGAQH